ncbi:uncharacterized protein LOC132047824 [Lycium ferocissimum]|uniref:uncharacterized protein LOC132047824 n=1 Tax=Lycium ferocissimum TaxID=112874 RepID=UPI0028153BC2|nr:uncharacterized protein LOC132047824 [Lycium ferocissimum]
MAIKYFNFRWKIGGILVSEVGPTFVGGRTEHSFNVDFDHLSIPELKDLAKEFGVNKLGTTYIAPKGGNLIKLTTDRDLLDLGVLLNDGETIEIYVCNDSSFEDGRPNGQHVTGGFKSLFQTLLKGLKIQERKIFASGEEVGDNANSSSDEELVNGSDSELSEDYESEVHEELRVVKEDLREYKKNKAVRVVAKEKVDGFLGEAGVDEGYEDIDRGRTNLRDKLGGDDDEPYYDSSDVGSFVSESDAEPVSDDDGVEGGTEMRQRRKSNRIVYDPDCEKVIWKVGQVFQNVKEFREALTKYALKKGVQLDKKKNHTRRVRVKCKTGCP